MTDRELILLHDLLEDLETDEGVCYKTRSSTCATACPLWYCIHRKRVCCKAFPDGIPGEHMNKLEENPAIECAPGVHYQPKT